MSGYNIETKVIQSDPKNCFADVEKTNFGSGTWAECNGVHNLTMGNSGSSGMLRFKNQGDDYILVALGVHNYVRWCDIVTDAKSTDTCMAVHPSYYSNAAGNRNNMLWSQLARLEKTTAKGVKVTVNYDTPTGTVLQVTITFSKA